VTSSLPLLHERSEINTSFFLTVLLCLQTVFLLPLQASSFFVRSVRFRTPGVLLSLFECPLPPIPSRSLSFLFSTIFPLSFPDGSAPAFSTTHKECLCRSSSPPSFHSDSDSPPSMASFGYFRCLSSSSPRLARPLLGAGALGQPRRATFRVPPQSSATM